MIGAQLVGLMSISICFTFVVRLMMVPFVCSFQLEGFREAEQDGRHWRQVQRGHEDQPVALHLGQRHLFAGRREEVAHSVQGLEADPVAYGLAGRQRQDADGKINYCSDPG